MRKKSIFIASAVLGAAVWLPMASAGSSPGANGRIAWSRDGDIFTMEADASDKRRLTDSPRVYESAQWSPDGQSLAVIRFGPKRSRIFLMNADGSDERPLANARFTVQSLAWSPDASRIAYCDMDIDNPDAPAPYPSAVKVVDLTTGTQTRLTDFEDKACSPTWSPDSSRIAFVAPNPTAPDVYPVITDIYVMDADGSNVQAVTNDADRQYGPTWSPTGDVIAFTRPVPAPGNRGDKEVVIETITSAGTNLTTLTEPTNEWDQLPQWSADGTRLLFFRSEMSGDYETHLAIANSDGSGEQVLAAVEMGNAAWSPDSTRIVFSRNDNIFVIGADGTGAIRLVGKKSTRDAAPDWQSL